VRFTRFGPRVLLVNDTGRVPPPPEPEAEPESEPQAEVAPAAVPIL
jgi:hypothetical protein